MLESERGSGDGQAAFVWFAMPLAVAPAAAVFLAGWGILAWRQSLASRR
jgi:hypothetical protein